LGDEGHQVVALIAQSLLDADVRKRINALLAADTDDLTAHDIASAATWADKYRDANFEGSRAKTRQWHFRHRDFSIDLLQQYEAELGCRRIIRSTSREEIMRRVIAISFMVAVLLAAPTALNLMS
jgi:hypothetical protein